MPSAGDAQAAGCKEVGMEAKKEHDKNESDFALIEVWKDCRSEIEMRIKQRDNFAMQFIIAVGVVLSAGLQNIPNSHFLIPWLMPLMSLYYSLQILYSYVMHDRLHDYVAYVIEPRIKHQSALGEDVRLWERECDERAIRSHQNTPGIRRSFFEAVPWLSAVFSGLLFLLFMPSRGGWSQHLDFGSGSFLMVAGTYISLLFCCMVVVVWKFVFLKRFTNREIDGSSCLGEEDPIDEHLKMHVGKCGQLSNKVIFIDRDGTLHRDKVNTHRIADFELLDGVVEGMKKLQEHGFSFVVVSNQDGIKRGLYGKDAMHRFNMHVVQELAKNGINCIAAIYYSPHDRDEDHPSFKPNCGMLIKARRKFNIDMSQAYMIGDQESDMIAAIKAGARPVFVTTGIYPKSYARMEAYNGVAIPAFPGFLLAAEWICKDCK